MPKSFGVKELISSAVDNTVKSLRVTIEHKIKEEILPELEVDRLKIDILVPQNENTA